MFPRLLLHFSIISAQDKDVSFPYHLSSFAKLENISLDRGEHFEKQKVKHDPGSYYFTIQRQNSFGISSSCNTG